MHFRQVLHLTVLVPFSMVQYMFLAGVREGSITILKEIRPNKGGATSQLPISTPIFSSLDLLLGFPIHIGHMVPRFLFLVEAVLFFRNSYKAATPFRVDV